MAKRTKKADLKAAALTLGMEMGIKDAISYLMNTLSCDDNEAKGLRQRASMLEELAGELRSYADDCEEDE